jgi:hypothetical protein
MPILTQTAALIGLSQKGRHLMTPRYFAPGWQLMERPTGIGPRRQAIEIIDSGFLIGNRATFYRKPLPTDTLDACKTGKIVSFDAVQTTSQSI